MKRKVIILSMVFLALACAGRRLLTLPSTHGPASISFLGFTNELVGSEAALAVGNECEALFHLTNHTASTLGFHIDIDASGVGSNSLTSLAAASGDLAGHTTYTVLVVTPAGSNGWRFRVATSISGPRPIWQQRIGMLLGRVGVHPLFLASERTYPQFTNVWTTR